MNDQDEATYTLAMILIGLPLLLLAFGIFG